MVFSFYKKLNTPTVDNHTIMNINSRLTINNNSLLVDDRLFGKKYIAHLTADAILTTNVFINREIRLEYFFLLVKSSTAIMNYSYGILTSVSYEIGDNQTVYVNVDLQR